MSYKIGISSIGLSTSVHAFTTTQLATLRNIDASKYVNGIGCEVMSIALTKEEVIDFSIKAAKRALAHWGGDLKDIGLLAVGTESSLDETRPLSAWIAQGIGLNGPVRSYEVKHACYGGTVALKQAIEWLDSRAAKDNQVALVIASDSCHYEPSSPPEPTQGAGAVAFIVSKNPTIASFDIKSYPYSRPSFDFWRPTGYDFPFVDAKESVFCYSQAIINTVEGFLKDNPKASVTDFKAFCCHVPFPKMAVKGVKDMLLKNGYTQESIASFLENKVTPYFEWNKKIGNAYTASLWLNVVNALKYSQKGDKFLCFSYGSGYGSELLVLDEVLSIPTPAIQEFEEDLKQRVMLTIEEYEKWQKDSGWTTHLMTKESST